MIKEINSVRPSGVQNNKATEYIIHTDKSDSDTIKSNKKFDSIEINKLISDNEKRINEFKEQIKKMIAKQGEESNITLLGQEINVSLEDSQKAAQKVEEGGEYSIEAVATRIMDMAKALSGGDKSKISLLKDAVKKGFEAAGMEFNDGAELPEICNKTYDEIMKRFDDWQKE